MSTLLPVVLWLAGRMACYVRSHLHKQPAQYSSLNISPGFSKPNIAPFIIRRFLYYLVKKYKIADFLVNEVMAVPG